MSAPQTNIESQKRHHRWPLIGIAAAIVVGVILGAMMMIGATDDPGAPVENLNGETVAPSEAAVETAPSTEAETPAEEPAQAAPPAQEASPETDPSD